jgi:hypothetical protein
MTRSLTVPPLVSGGVMLSYRCTNTCRHCMYRCSPKRADAWITLDQADAILDALAREPQLMDIHYAGGEAMLKPDLLAEIIRRTVARGIDISYLETNGFWASSVDQAEAEFRKLAEAGLEAVLISASPFHIEFTPWKRTRNCIEGAQRVFGASGTIVWTYQVARVLDTLDDSRTYTCEEFLDAIGHADDPDMLERIYPIKPHGRVVEAMRECYPRQSAEAFEGQSCANTLESTVHFHIDPDGRLFTGSCPGITVSRADNYHPTITETSHPLYTRLHAAGPYELMEWAIAEHGYTPRDDGYIAKCDLCYHVRLHLCDVVPGVFSELDADEFYATD